LSIVNQAKHNGILADALKGGQGLVHLHLSMAQITEVTWEDLWEEAHPDRPNDAWAGEDCELMGVWRERAAATIRECDQGWILELDDADEYIQALLADGADEETAQILTDWLKGVRYEAE
jgi:hypothetical protein